MRWFELRGAGPSVGGVSLRVARRLGGLGGPVGLGALMVIIAVGFAPERAAAQERIDIDVIVSHISGLPGKIDPRGRRVHEKLRSQIRYESLRVLQQRRLDLRIDQVGSMDLPNSRKLRLRPMDVGERGVLLAVEVEGSLDSDLRIPNHHLVVLGTEAFEEGKLVISLEPSW